MQPEILRITWDMDKECFPKGCKKWKAKEPGFNRWQQELEVQIDLTKCSSRNLDRAMAINAGGNN